MALHGSSLLRGGNLGGRLDLATVVALTECRSIPLVSKRLHRGVWRLRTLRYSRSGALAQDVCERESSLASGGIWLSKSSVFRHSSAARKLRLILFPGPQRSRPKPRSVLPIYGLNTHHVEAIPADVSRLC